MRWPGGDMITHRFEVIPPEAADLFYPPNYQLLPAKRSVGYNTSACPSSPVSPGGGLSVLSPPPKGSESIPGTVLTVVGTRYCVHPCQTRPRPTFFPLFTERPFCATAGPLSLQTAKMRKWKSDAGFTNYSKYASATLRSGIRRHFSCPGNCVRLSNAKRSIDEAHSFSASSHNSECELCESSWGRQFHLSVTSSRKLDPWLLHAACYWRDQRWSDEVQYMLRYEGTDVGTSTL
ncbi:hypothetical protein VTK56DRAFT_8505 [Thermocarpiscus australiensis]